MGVCAREPTILTHVLPIASRSRGTLDLVHPWSNQVRIPSSRSVSHPHLSLPSSNSFPLLPIIGSAKAKAAELTKSLQSTQSRDQPLRRQLPVGELLSLLRRQSPHPPLPSVPDPQPFIPPPTASTAVLPPQPTLRRPPGPPPPRSWTSNRPHPPIKRRERTHPTAPALSTNDLYPAYQIYSPSSSSPPRLVSICLASLAFRLASTIEKHTIRDELGSLPRHLRELLVWWIGMSAVRSGSIGLRDDGVEALMWDLRDWGDQGSEADGPDEWEDPSEYEEGWNVLFAPNSLITIPMLKILLHPLPTQPPRPTGIHTLCLSSPIHHSLSSLIGVFPLHLRFLDLHGIKLFHPSTVPLGPVEWGEMDDGERWNWWTLDRESRVMHMLRKLAASTPMLQVRFHVGLNG